MATNPSAPVFRQPTAMERAFNRFFGFLVGLGFGLKHNYLLQVRGRKSGKLYSTPIDLLEISGKRFWWRLAAARSGSATRKQPAMSCSRKDGRDRAIGCGRLPMQRSLH